MSDAPGLVIAAPASGSGKTTLTFAILAALNRAGVRVAACKVGPDYIDPAFHEAASGRPCRNLDGWSMRPATLAQVMKRAAEGIDLLLVEGVMGLFDGAPDGTGSTAELAAGTALPVVLVVDASGQAASAAALVHGFNTFHPGLSLAGVIFNRVGSDSHAALLRCAVAPLGIPVLGCLPAGTGLALPSRHLGLVQACETEALGALLETAADWVERNLDLDRLRALARVPRQVQERNAVPFAPLGGRIAIARDSAFAFVYPHMLDVWHDAGASLLPFSPLQDEPAAADTDAVLLPGGYPELHAGCLAGNACFLKSLGAAVQRGAAVYGECGGYMVMGEGLIDASGTRHQMAGLLPVETSFASPRLHLGYRDLCLLADGPLGRRQARFRGHEFHYATTTAPGVDPLFHACDAHGHALGAVGCRNGTAFGSFIHLVDSL